ncbi:MAG: acyl-CoA carboxylase epsilon subunit [Propionibacteriaceae bacterium]
MVINPAQTIPTQTSPATPGRSTSEIGAGVRVVTGDPTPTEVAAVVAALGAVAGPGAATPHRTKDGWSGYWRSVRTLPQSAARR